MQIIMHGWQSFAGSTGLIKLMLLKVSQKPKHAMKQHQDGGKDHVASKLGTEHFRNMVRTDAVYSLPCGQVQLQLLHRILANVSHAGVVDFDDLRLDDDGIEKKNGERGGRLLVPLVLWYLQIFCVLLYLTKSTPKSSDFNKKHVELFFGCT